MLFSVIFFFHFNLEKYDGIRTGFFLFENWSIFRKPFVRIFLCIRISVTWYHDKNYVKTIYFLPFVEKKGFHYLLCVCLVSFLFIFVANFFFVRNWKNLYLFPIKHEYLRSRASWCLSLSSSSCDSYLSVKS